MATLGTYDETAEAGADDLTVTDIAGSPTSYTVRDIENNVIAEGSMSGDSVTIPAPEGGWPPGWFFCTFNSPVWLTSTGYVADALQVTVLRPGSPLPPVPAVGTDPNAADPNARGFDIHMHAFTAMGLQRYQIHDATAPTVYTPSTEQGGTIAAIQANIAAEQDGGYLDPAYADPARPRHEFITFPNNFSAESGYAAGVTATVAALGPGSAYGVLYFEGINEPFHAGLTPAQAGAQYNAFRTAVKAGHADAQAIGPDEVAFAPVGSDLGPTIANLTTFLANVTPGTLDGFSVHNYGSANGDFIALDGWLAAARDALDAAGYPPDLPMFYTESGWITAAWNCYDPRRLVQWAITLYLTGERWGMPKENIYWFLDTYIAGFSDGHIKDGTGDLRPYATFLRVLSEEVFGKTYDEGLDFGTIGNSFYRGNVYRGEDGACVALYAQGNPGDTVTLAVSDEGPITYSDWGGITNTAAVIDGQITLAISDLPIYVRLSADCDVSVVDVGNGIITGGPANISSAATAVSGSGADDPDLAIDGTYQTDGYLPGPDYVFKGDYGTLPDHLELQWDEPQTITKVLIRQVPPWSNRLASAMTKGRLECWNGSGWLPCPTVVKADNHWDAAGNYDNSTATSFLGQSGGLRRSITFYDANWCHNVDFSVPVVTTRLRWTVTRGGYGHIPDEFAATYAPFGFKAIENVQPRLMASEIVVLESTSEIPTFGPLKP